MTRDTKLALILAASVLLIVLLLISDHIAAEARPQQGEPASSLVSNTQAQPALGLAPPQQLQPDPDPAPEQPSITQRLAGVLDDTVDIAQRVIDSPGMGAAINELPQQIQQRPDQVPELVLGPNNNPNPISSVPQIEFNFHRVATGDTLWSIADRYYNDPSLHRELARYNANNLGPNNTLILNQELLIPPRHKLEPNAPPDRTKPATTTTTYTVQSGDVLSVISQKQLGTAKRWREILELNRDKIDTPEDLRAGMTLRLPAT